MDGVIKTCAVVREIKGVNTRLVLGLNFTVVIRATVVVTADDGVLTLIHQSKVFFIGCPGVREDRDSSGEHDGW